jgi:predicted dithiol-disulfide oxidoreductase (DUF899 family)
MADTYGFPRVASGTDWEKAIAELRVAEKALTRAQDELNARRRRLPMVKIDKHYELQGEEGTVELSDLFGPHQQLIVYHFMFGPDEEAGCPGCSWVTDAMSHPAHLHARNTNLVLVSRAPLARLLAYRKRMGWDLPWYSSAGSDFNYDFNATNERGENHVVSVFLKNADAIYRTYYTDARGVEHLGSHWTYLDMTPFGRQEPWEDSPEGRPVRDMHWTKRHNEYT